MKSEIMDEKFKTICKLIERQCVTYYEAYSLLEMYFEKNSKPSETLGDKIYFTCEEGTTHDFETLKCGKSPYLTYYHH